MNYKKAYVKFFWLIAMPIWTLVFALPLISLFGDSDLILAKTITGNYQLYGFINLNAHQANNYYVSCLLSVFVFTVLFVIELTFSRQLEDK